MTDYRRKANARFAAAMGLTCLMRVHMGKYWSYAQIATHADVSEITVRNWFRGLREDYGVRIERDSRGPFVVAEWGCLERRRVLAWLQSGLAFAGALNRGEYFAPGYVPQLEFDWAVAGDPVPKGGPVFAYAGDDDEIDPEELPL